MDDSHKNSTSQAMLPAKDSQKLHLEACGDGHFGRVAVDCLLRRLVEEFKVFFFVWLMFFFFGGVVKNGGFDFQYLFPMSGEFEIMVFDSYS